MSEYHNISDNNVKKDAIIKIRYFLSFLYLSQNITNLRLNSLTLELLLFVHLFLLIYISNSSLLFTSKFVNRLEANRFYMNENKRTFQLLREDPYFYLMRTHVLIFFAITVLLYVTINMVYIILYYITPFNI